MTSSNQRRSQGTEDQSAAPLWSVPRTADLRCVMGGGGGCQGRALGLGRHTRAGQGMGRMVRDGPTCFVVVFVSLEESREVLISTLLDTLQSDPPPCVTWWGNPAHGDALTRQAGSRPPPPPCSCTTHHAAAPARTPLPANIPHSQPSSGKIDLCARARARGGGSPEDQQAPFDV